MEAVLFLPQLIHVPIALGVLMPFIAGGLLLAWWRNWLARGAWVIALALQTILVGSGVLAIRSVEAEEHRVERVVAESFIDTHEGAAQASSK